MMDFMNIIWIILIVTSLLPVIRKHMLNASRYKLMKQIEDQRKSRVIALIHRQESMNILGFPIAKYIDIQDSEAILRAIKLTDHNMPIDLILHTPGGLVLAAEQIANALCRHKGQVTVIVPHYAMSGGTLIALAADSIIMDENAVLGPVDPQLGQYPAASILKVLETKDANEVDDQTVILADISRKAMKQVKDTIRQIASHHYESEQVEKLIEELSTGKYTHDFPIEVEHAQSMGLNVSTDMPETVYQLMNLFPQADQRRPSVEYIPLPYNIPPAPKGNNGKPK